MHHFVCHTCGSTHEGLPTDHGWTLPDVVWAIPEEERAIQAKFDSDLCQLGERYFIRCVLKLPFNEQRDFFSWGIWVEVAKQDFWPYVELYNADGRSEPAISGAIANMISGYRPTLGLPVMVQFQTSTSRPSVIVPNGSDHPLAAEQIGGISNQRHHDMLVATGSLPSHHPASAQPA